MTKQRTIWVGLAVLSLLIGGCGHKAPPYYEKPAPQKGSGVAL